MRCETAGVAIGEAVRLLFRAEDVQLAPQGSGELVGTVARTVYTGGGLLYIDVGGRFLKVRAVDKVQPGQRVTLQVVKPPQCFRWPSQQEDDLAGGPAVHG